ncbi:hypothetical protein D3C81_2222020 [compost metagenome]
MHLVIGTGTPGLGCQAGPRLLLAATGRVKQPTTRAGEQQCEEVDQLGGMSGKQRPELQ